MLTLPSNPPHLLADGSMIHSCSLQIMPSRPACQLFNTEVERSTHPCQKCLPVPPCGASSRWSPTYCSYCIAATKIAISEPTVLCPQFYKLLRYWRKRAYSIDPFAKALDFFAFQCILSASLKFVPPHDAAFVWDKDLLLSVCEVAVNSDFPYQIFKSMHDMVSKGQRLVDPDVLLKQSQKAVFSPPRPRSRSRARTPAVVCTTMKPSSGITSGSAPKSVHSAAAGAKNPRISKCKNRLCLTGAHDIISKAFASVFDDSDQEDPQHVDDNSQHREWSDASSAHSDADMVSADESYRSVAPSSDDESYECHTDDEELGQNIDHDEDRELGRNNRSQPPSVNDSQQYQYSTPSRNQNRDRSNSPGDVPVSPPHDQQNLNIVRSQAPNTQGENVQLVAQTIDLPEGVLRVDRRSFVPPAKSRVVNEAVARIEFLSGNEASGGKEGWYLVAAELAFSTHFFRYRTVGELTVITPTTAGTAYPTFMEIFGSFREYTETNIPLP